MRQKESVPVDGGKECAKNGYSRRAATIGATLALIATLGACSSGKEAGKTEATASSSTRPSGSASANPSSSSTPMTSPYALESGDTCLSAKGWSNFEKRDWLGGLLGEALLTSSDVTFNKTTLTYPGSGPLCQKIPIKVAFFTLSGDKPIDIRRNEIGLAIDGSETVTVKLDPPSAAPVDPGMSSCEGSGTAVYIGDEPLVQGKDWPDEVPINDGGTYVTERDFGTGDRIAKGRLFCDGAKVNPGAIGGPIFPEMLPAVPDFGTSGL